MWHCEDKAEWYLYHFTQRIPYRAVTLHHSLHTSSDCFHLSLPSHRSAFTMHVEAGHSAVPEEGPKDLRCPLCLYHTKYKRNMIDHIVLHRGNNIPVCVCIWWEECWTMPFSFRLVSLIFSISVHHYISPSLYPRTSMVNKSSALEYLFFSFLIDASYLFPVKFKVTLCWNRADLKLFLSFSSGEVNSDQTPV